MAIAYRDYYETLGISRSAGDEEIRRAFRRLAREYHPDVTGNDRYAEDKFKEINEAYEVLGDPDRRRRYDEFTLSYQHAARGNVPPGWGSFAESTNGNGGRAEHFTFTGTGFSEFFDQLFGSNNRTTNSNRERPPQRERSSSSEDSEFGDDLETDLFVTLEEVARGAVRRVTMRRAVRCNACYGMGQYNAHSCDRCDGKGSMLKNVTFQVKVPRGVPEGACLKVPGQGEEAWRGNHKGDLYLKVKYARNPDFHVEQGQLIHDLELAPWEAALGTTVTIQSLDGKLNIKVPPGTQHGQKLRIRGKGLPALDSVPGDLLVQVRIRIPVASKDRERDLWQELARESSFAPRQN